MKKSIKIGEKLAEAGVKAIQAQRDAIAVNKDAVAVNKDAVAVNNDRGEAAEKIYLDLKKSVGHLIPGLDDSYSDCSDDSEVEGRAKARRAKARRQKNKFQPLRPRVSSNFESPNKKKPGKKKKKNPFKKNPPPRVPPLVLPALMPMSMKNLSLDPNPPGFHFEFSSLNVSISSMRESHPNHDVYLVSYCHNEQPDIHQLTGNEITERVFVPFIHAILLPKGSPKPDRFARVDKMNNQSTCGREICENKVFKKRLSVLPFEWELLGSFPDGSKAWILAMKGRKSNNSKRTQDPWTLCSYLYVPKPPEENDEFPYPFESDWITYVGLRDPYKLRELDVTMDVWDVLKMLYKAKYPNHEKSPRNWFDKTIAKKAMLDVLLPLYVEAYVQYYDDAILEENGLKDTDDPKWPEVLKRIEEALRYVLIEHRNQILEGFEDRRDADARPKPISYKVYPDGELLEAYRGSKSSYTEETDISPWVKAEVVYPILEENENDRPEQGQPTRNVDLWGKAKSGDGDGGEVQFDEDNVLGSDDEIEEEE